MKKLFTVSVLLMMFGISMNAQNENMVKKLKGTWNYTSNDAPYQYQKGKAIFYEEDKEFKAKIDIDGSVIHAKDLKIKEQNVEFIVYVENERVVIKLTLSDYKMKGKAETYDGDLNLTLEKEKS